MNRIVVNLFRIFKVKFEILLIFPMRA